MNKSHVEKLIPKAINAIRNSSICKDNKVEKTYQSKISTFGAAISQGSLYAAYMFFSKKDSKSKADLTSLLSLVEVLAKEEQLIQANESLANYIEQDKVEAKNNIIDICIAIKLALNAFDRGESNGE